MYSEHDVINLLDEIISDMRCDRNSILYTDSVYNVYNSAIEVVESRKNKILKEKFLTK